MKSITQKLLATVAAVPLAVGLTSGATMFKSGGAALIEAAKAACNPCVIKKSGCNPCAPADWAGNPCAAEKAASNPCAAEKAAGIPCAAEKTACNPCAVQNATCAPCQASEAACNPCAVSTAANNPCAADNPCAVAIPEVESTMPVDKIIAALKSPPKQSVGKIYSLEEIEKDFEVRNLLQAVEVKSVSFDFDSTDVKGMQAQYLGNIGAAISKILEDRPDEVFFVEGHADAPGTDAYNLKLSKERALQIKSALVNLFGIPEKNIVAAGFGEKHLKIATERREESNRRVTVRCITPLVVNLSKPAQ